MKTLYALTQEFLMLVGAVETHIPTETSEGVRGCTMVTETIRHQTKVVAGSYANCFYETVNAWSDYPGVPKFIRRNKQFFGKDDDPESGE